MSDRPATLAARLLRSSDQELAARMLREPGRFIRDAKAIAAALVDRQPNRKAPTP